MKGRHLQSLLFALALLSLLLVSNSSVQAQGSSKAGPATQLLLLSEQEAAEPNIVFVTSTTYDGNLGGLAGADQKCQARAEAAGLPKNTYKAWLSTPSVNAIDRLGSARGWVRVDGKPFADTKADISIGKVFHPIRVDELGIFDDSPWGSQVWTGTIPDGTVHSVGTCNGWTSSSTEVSGFVGNDDGVGGAFTSYGGPSCDHLYRLYCFGMDNRTPVTVTPVAGRIAFLTKSHWIPSGGLAGADQLCMAEAQQAGLSGSFKALLATAGASAASRFDSNGQPWVRRDGVAIAPSAAELFTSTFLNTGINQSADGLQYFGNHAVWTGADYPTWGGTLESTCNNWTSASDTYFGTNGSAGFTYSRLSFGWYGSKCDQTYLSLYCLQE